MQLPYTSNKLLFWMDPAEKFVSLDSSNRITSMLNRVDGNPIVPFAGAPTWVDNSLNGQPTLSFTGAQSITFNMNDNVALVGIRKPLMMTVVAKCLTFSGGGNFLIMAANKTVPPTCQFIQFGNLGINAVIDQRTTDTGQFIISPFTIATDSNYHVYSSVYDGLALRFRIDGIEVDVTSANNLTTSAALTQICIGGTSPTKIASIGNAYFTGNVATALAYTSLQGVPFDYSIEEYLMNYYGIPVR